MKKFIEKCLSCNSIEMKTAYHTTSKLGKKLVKNSIAGKLLPMPSAKLFSCPNDWWHLSSLRDRMLEINLAYIQPIRIKYSKSQINLQKSQSKKKIQAISVNIDQLDTVELCDPISEYC